MSFVSEWLVKLRKGSFSMGLLEETQHPSASGSGAMKETINYGLYFL